jgi:type III pantothenate kinase
MAIFFLLGNSTVKVSARRGSVSVVAIDAAREELPALLKPYAGRPAIAACVNPPCEPMLAQACRDAGLGAPLYAGRDLPIHMDFDVENPSTVGIDRVLNVKAAYAVNRRAAATVDLGTAVSVSVVDDDGRFVGGAILPGMSLACRSLASGTASLPLVCPSRPKAALGKSTVAAMESGVFYGTLGAVREIISRVSSELDTDIRVFVTGGDSALMRSDLPDDWTYAPGLTMEGLRLVYEEHR